MKILNIKNKRIRKVIKKLEQNRFILKTISSNSNLFYLTRWKAFFQLRNLTKNSSTTRMTNRCIISGRKKRLSKILNVSRLVFLNFARLTEISGIRKAVW
jgi:small subunit ribosomal protein S14